MKPVASLKLPKGFIFLHSLQQIFFRWIIIRLRTKTIEKLDLSGVQINLPAACSEVSLKMYPKGRSIKPGEKIKERYYA